MPTTMTVSAARAALPRILERVAAGEEIQLTRHGAVVAVIVGPDALRWRRAGDAFAAATSIGAVLDRGRSENLAASPAMSRERAELLVSEIRAERESR